MAQEAESGEELAALVQDTGEAAAAYMRGEMRRYLDLMKPATDYTLMSPVGGEPTRGHDDSEEAIAATSQFFRNGDAQVELVESYTSGDIVVLVLIERQHGEVGGLPDQDWSLRVTQVFQRDGSDWHVVHRHADPLTHGITFEQAAQLARGAEPS
jgi:ketosteroid isomerase-like protein